MGNTIYVVEKSDGDVEFTRTSLFGNPKTKDGTVMIDGKTFAVDARTARRNHYRLKRTLWLKEYVDYIYYYRENSPTPIPLFTGGKTDSDFTPREIGNVLRSKRRADVLLGGGAQWLWIIMGLCGGLALGIGIGVALGRL